MKQLILLAIFITATMLSYSQKTLKGKTYEALIGREEADGEVTIGRELVRKEVNGVIFLVEEGAPIVKMIGGCTLAYCVLTFEKNNVLISFRYEMHGEIYSNHEKEILSEHGKFFYTVKNQTVKIKNSMIYGLESGKDFILIIKDDGHTLLIDENTNPFQWKDILFSLKAL